MKLLALFLLLSTCGHHVAIAQAGSNWYAAPGMPTLLQRGLPVNPPAKTKPWLTEQLPRFWHTADAVARQQEARQVMHALRQRVNYLKIALQQQLEGEVVICAQLTPAGEPQRIVVRKTIFASSNPAPEAANALKFEAIRVAQLLRFQPYTGTSDSVVFPLKFAYL